MYIVYIECVFRDNSPVDLIVHGLLNAREKKPKTKPQQKQKREQVKTSINRIAPNKNDSKLSFYNQTSEILLLFV